MPEPHPEPTAEEIWDAFEDSKDEVRFLLEWIATHDDREHWKKAIDDLNAYRAERIKEQDNATA